MGIALTILGCDGSYAGPGGSCSGYLLRTETTSIWLDAGPGTLGAVQQHVELTDLDAIVVSHEHPDHCLELPVVRNALKYVLGVEGVPVLTTAGVRHLVDHISEGAEPTFVWDVVADGDQRTVGDIELAFARTDHPVETLAVRAEQAGRAIAYTADTGSTFSFGAFGAPVHLALCEASLAPERQGSFQHLTAAEAGALAREAGAEHLLLTHLTPGSDAALRCAEAASTYDGLISSAVPGDTHEV